MESADNSKELPDGIRPGTRVGCSGKPQLVGDNDGVRELSFQLAGATWGQVRIIVSGQATAALKDYIACHCFSLESCLAACWGELIRCYSEQQPPVTLHIARESHIPPGIYAVCVPAADGKSVRGWLSDVARCIDGSTDVYIGAAPRNERNEASELAEKLSSGTVIGYRATPGSHSGELNVGAEHLLLIEAVEGSTIELRATYRKHGFSSALVEVLLECTAYMLEQLPVLDMRRACELQLTASSVCSPQIDPENDQRAFDGIRCVHEEIREQSRRAPEEIAVICGADQITYGKLNYRANQLARYLISHGARPDSLVAVQLNRSIDLLITLVGVLKAGAAFLPLDISLPKQRVAAILKDSECPIVVTSSDSAASFGDPQVRVLCIDSEWAAWQRESGDNFDSPARMNDLAYVTYTSGSTGAPKGVMIEHRNLSACIAGMEEILGTEPGVWLAAASISFDIAVTELLWTLAHRFRIVIHQGDEGAPVISGSQSIAAQIRQHGVTHFQGTPTLIRMILTDPECASALYSLRKLLVGGEPFPPSLAGALLQLMSGEFFNVYGPTETTICATYHPVKQAQNPVPIGRPTGKARTYVLDEAGRIVPPLAAGELFVGGDLVGRGYLRRPDLTSERFVRDPFSSNQDARLYRTGDRVRVALDGSLEFLGRLDLQVKIRGFRIELGEIEAVLRAYPGVEHAAVVVRGEASADKTLAGFVVVRPEFRVCADDIAESLRQVLPSYMIPSSLICLDAFPLTPNGKVDREKLAALDSRRNGVPPLETTAGTPNQSGMAEVLPLDSKLQEMEHCLCAWCSELLDIPNVTPTMDFFEMGGHSLIAAQLVQRIARRYGVHIRLSTFLKLRTMRGLADFAYRADNPAAREPWSPVIAVRANGGKPPLFLVAGLGGNVVNFERLSRFLADDRPVYAVETQGTNNKYEILTSIEDMARTYLAEVQRLQPQGPYYLCGYSFGGVIAFEMAQQLRAAGQEVGMVSLIDMPEWQYTQRVMTSFNILERMRALYGGTVKRILFGPDRMKAFLARLAAGYDICWSALDRLRGRHPHPAVARPNERNFYALTHYTAKFYPGDIHLFRCPDPSPFRGRDPLLGWGELAGRIIVCDIPGEHGSLTTEPYVGSLGRALRQSLDALEARPGGNMEVARPAVADNMASRLVASA